MMSKDIRDSVKDKLDVRLLSLLIFMTVVEFEVFTYARAVVKTAEQDFWLAIIAGTSILVVNALVLVKLANRFPKENFFEYCSKVWGRVLGFVIKLAYLLYWFATLSIIFIDFSAANTALFLPRTPKIVPLLLLALGAFWVVSYGLAAVIRFFQIMVLFMVPPLLLVGTLGLSQIDLDNLRPLFSHDPVTILKSGFLFASIYQGLEIILFAGPFLTNPKKMVKPAIIGTIAGTFFPLFLGFSAVGTLGVQNIKYSIWPGIDTVSMIMLPGFPVERYELFLTMPWLIALFTTICIFLYFIGYGIKQTFHLRHRSLTVGVTVLLAIASTYIVPNYAWALKYRENLTLITFMFIAIIPFLTLILAMVRGKEDTK